MLYIDDDPTNRLLMEAFFTLRPQLELTLANDGLSGVSAAISGQYALILTDMVLPDIDGLQVLSMLREVDETREVPCVAVSAMAYPEKINEALRAGFDSYITKPFTVTDLFAALDHHLNLVEETPGAPPPAPPSRG